MISSLIFDFRGELAAISAALIWAIASVIYAGIGRHLSPLALNFTKGVIAIAFIGITLALRGELYPETSGWAVGLLAVSGAVGIGFGDTAFFAALNSIGARRVLLIEALAPPLSAFLALLFLHEQLSLRDCMGIGLTISGVAWVIAERVPDTDSDHRQVRRGIGLGILAALGQASGAVLSRAALVDTDISPLWSTLIRLLAGTAVLFVWVLMHHEGMQVLKPLRSRRRLAIVAGTSFAGTFLAIWLQQISLKYTETGIAQSLNATSPLFVLPVAIALGERISLRAVFGVLLALGGVWLLFQ